MGIWHLPTNLPLDRAYLTRDGEFHWGIHPNDPFQRVILLDKNGLVVISDHGDFKQWVGFVTKNFFDEKSHPTHFRGRPSIVDTSTPYNQLKFSKYGSTSFQPAQRDILVIVNGSANQLSNGTTMLCESALEVSNSALSHNIPEISLAQKFYTALAKVIQAHSQNFDSIVNLIR